MRAARVLLAGVMAAAAVALLGPASARAHEPPGWAREAVFYGAIPERFEGGDLDAVRHRLPYLDRLGVDAIWLSPITATLPDDFGYAVRGYRRIRRSYGSKPDLRALVRAAHARGIRVLMDWVPNHTSRAHRWFQSAREGGPGSRFWDFYERGPGGRPRHYFDWRDLPNLNYSNPRVRRAIIAASRYWVREFGIDGFRVDAAWGVRRRAPGFWPRWTRAMRRTDPDVFLLAEASAKRPYYRRAGFDAAYDWTRELGHWAWQGAFADPARIGERLRAAMAGGRAGELVLRFLNNNDTGRRFVARHGVARTRAAAALLLTAPGIPLVYMGDETGARFDPYSLARPIDWRDREGLRSHYRRLIELRGSLRSLQGSSWRAVWRGAGATFAFARPPRGGDPAALVALNFSGRPQRVSIEAGALPPSLRTGPLADALGAVRAVDLGVTGGRVPVGRFGARVLVAADSLAATR